MVNAVEVFDGLSVIVNTQRLSGSCEIFVHVLKKERQVVAEQVEITVCQQGHRFNRRQVAERHAGINGPEVTADASEGLPVVGLAGTAKPQDIRVVKSDKVILHRFLVYRFAVTVVIFDHEIEYPVLFFHFGMIKRKDGKIGRVNHVLQFLGFEVLREKGIDAHFPFFLIIPVLGADKMGGTNQQLLLQFGVFLFFARFFVQFLKREFLACRNLRFKHQHIGSDGTHKGPQYFPLTVEEHQGGQGFHFVAFHHLFIGGRIAV